MSKANNSKLIIKIKALKLLHALIMVLCFVFVWDKWFQPMFHSSYNLTLFNIAAVIAYCFCILFLARVYRAYAIGVRCKSEIFLAQILTLILSMIVLYAINTIAWWRTEHFRSILPMLALVFVQMILSVIWINVAEKLYFKWIKPSKTIILYRNSMDLQRLSDIYNFEKQYRVEDCIQFENFNKELELKILSSDTVFITGIDSNSRDDILKLCVQNDINAYIIPHVGDLLVSGYEHAQQFSTPVLKSRSINQSVEYFIVKRLFDIVVSATSLIVLSPLFLIVSICIKLDSPGSVFYKQTRLTIGGKKFELIKFRSMCMDAEQDGVARLAKENDRRITKVGNFIRKYRIDELPQLINILHGDMTIVGPRPERPEIAQQYNEAIPSFNLRLQVKSGLTGYAQVYGRYNTDPYDKLEMDLIYINKMNIFLDLQLMLATVATLFSKEATEGLKGNRKIALGDIKDKCEHEQ